MERFLITKLRQIYEDVSLVKERSGYRQTLQALVFNEFCAPPQQPGQKMTSWFDLLLVVRRKCMSLSDQRVKENVLTFGESVIFAGLFLLEANKLMTYLWLSWNILETSQLNQLCPIPRVSNHILMPMICPSYHLFKCFHKYVKHIRWHPLISSHIQRIPSSSLPVRSVPSRDLITLCNDWSLEWASDILTVAHSGRFPQKTLVKTKYLPFR